MDAETVTNNTLAKAIDQFEQVVLAVEWWRTLAEGTSEPFSTMSSRSISRSSQSRRLVRGIGRRRVHAREQIRDAFRFLDLFTTSHLKEKYEDEFAELDGQLDVAKLMAHCTICKAKMWPNFVVLAGRGDQVHDFGPWVVRDRPVADGAIDGVNSKVVRRNT